MRCLITTTYAVNFDSLAELVIPNHLKYCRKHGYDYNLHHTPTFNGPTVYFNVNLELVMRMLPVYDMIVSIDFDLLFMDLNVTLESLIPEEAKQMMAEENIGGSPYNAGVIFWKNDMSSHNLIKHILDTRKQNEDRIHNWQDQLVDLLKVNDPLVRNMQIVPGHLINAYAGDNKPEEQWKKGDFICHFFCAALPSKIDLANKYLPLVEGN